MARRSSGQSRSGDFAVRMILQAQDNASKVLLKTQESLSGLAGGFERISAISQKIAFIGIAFQQVQGVINAARATVAGFYNSFIQSNIQLQEQLLATQASLVATNDIVVGGIKVEDPTAAIQALEQPVNEAIEGLRRDSLDLVGVTSAELVPIFQLLAQEGANIGASLEDAKDLTIDFSASLGTLGIPLFQARQEVQSILTGQISSDSQLAKSIGLNNEQVKLWKEQGVLVERLRERLEAFRAGNALAAQTIGGVSSNIAEVFQEVTRIAGAPLLAPIVEQLTRFYDFLNENRGAIEDSLGAAIAFINQAGERAIAVVDALLPSLQKLGGELLKAFGGGAAGAGQAALALLDVVAALATSLTPLINVVAELVGIFADFASTGVGRTAIEIGVLIVVVNALLPVLASLALNALAASVNMVAFAVSLKGVAISAAAAAAPVLALAAAIAVLAIAIQTDRLREAGDAIDAYGETVGSLGDEAIETARKIRELNRIEEEGGRLTEEQQRQRELLINLAGQQQDAIGNLRGEIESLQPANEEQRRAQEALISNLNSSEGALTGATGGVQLLGNALQNLTRSIQQASAEIGREELVIDLDQSQQLAQLQEQLNSGLITESEFQEESNRLTQEGLQERLSIVSDRVADLKAEYEALSEEEKEQATESLAEIQKLEKQQADLQLQAAQGRFETEQKDLERAQKRATDTIKRAATEREIELADLRNQGLLSEREYQSELLGASLERIDQEIAAEEQKLADILATRGAGSDTRAAEQRILELQKQRIDAEQQQEVQAEGDRQKRETDGLRRRASLREIELRQQRSQGILSERELQNELSAINADRIDEELAAEQAKLERLKGIYDEDSDEVQASQQRILDLTNERLQSEISLQQAAQEEIQRAIDARALAAQNAATRETQGLEEQLRLYEGLNSVIEQQSQLLQAQADLRQAENNLISGNLGIAADLTKNERERQRLQAQAAVAQLEALREQQAFEDQSLLIQQELERLAVRRRQIEAEAAEIQARAALAQAEADRARTQAAFERGDANAGEVEAANLQVEAAQSQIEAAQQRRGLADQEAAFLPQQQAIARQRQEIEQQGAENQARAAVVQALPENSGARRRAAQQERERLLSGEQLQTGRSTRATNNLAERALAGGDTNALGDRPVSAELPQLTLDNAIAPLQTTQESGNQFLEAIAANTAQPAPSIAVTVNVNGGATNEQTGQSVAAAVREQVERILDRAAALQAA